MTKEFLAWKNAVRYTEIEQINWLLRAVATMEAKEKYSQDVRNNLYAIIKQQQAKLDEQNASNCFNSAFANAKTPVDNASTRKPGEFRVGDRVRRINNANTARVPVGSIGTVVSLENRGLYSNVAVNWDHCPPQSDVQGTVNYPNNLEVIAPATSSILNDPAVREQLEELQTEITRLRDNYKGAVDELHKQRDLVTSATRHADEMQRRLLQIYNFCQGYNTK